MLEIANLSVNYGAINALKSFTVSAQAGAITAVLGANGAGKSSLLKALSGLSPTTEGSVKLDREDITRLSAPARAKLGIAHAMEGRRLFRHLSVSENLRLAWHFGARQQALQDSLEQIFDRFPILAEKEKTQSGLLSGGQQQMMILSCATIRYPRVLLLDEPSLGLSPLITTQIYKFIGDYAQSSGVIVVLTEQMASIALKVSKRVCVLRQGRVVFAGDTKEMTKAGRSESLSSMYL